MPLLLLKWIGGPGSVGFLAAASLVGVLAIRLTPRLRTAGRVWLLALYCSYVILGLPVVAHAITAPLVPSDAVPHTPTTGLDVVIVFDGDNRLGRLHEALRLWESTHPKTIVVSGADWLVDRLTGGGVPPGILIHERASSTTREQIQYVQTYLSTRPGARAAIVASRLQMPRVMALARRANLQVTFYPSPVDREPVTSGYRLYVPTYSALRVSRDGLYECVALAYYRAKGWTDAGGISAVASAR